MKKVHYKVYNKIIIKRYNVFQFEHHLICTIEWIFLHRIHPDSGLESGKEIHTSIGIWSERFSASQSNTQALTTEFESAKGIK